MTGRHIPAVCTACAQERHSYGRAVSEILTTPDDRPVMLLRRTCACPHCPCPAAETTVAVTGDDTQVLPALPPATPEPPP